MAKRKGRDFAYVRRDGTLTDAAFHEEILGEKFPPKPIRDYNPHHAPAGSSRGGQFTSGGGGSGGGVVSVALAGQRLAAVTSFLKSNIPVALGATASILVDHLTGGEPSVSDAANHLVRTLATREGIATLSLAARKAAEDVRALIKIRKGGGTKDADDEVLEFLEQLLAELEKMAADTKDAGRYIKNPETGKFEGSEPGGGEGEGEQAMSGFSNLKGGELTEKEIETVTFYADEGFDVNAKLRKGQKLTKEEAKFVKDLDAVLERSTLREDVELFRGTGNTIGGMLERGELKPGDYMPEKGFISTTFDEGQASDLFSPDHPPILIYAYKGHRGLDIGDISGKPEEAEVLLPRTSKLIYLGKSEGRHEFQVE